MKKSSKKKSSSEAATKTDLAQMESRLTKQMDVKTDAVKSELKSDIAEAQSELKSDIAEAQSELKSDLAKSKAELIRHMDVKTDAVKSELKSDIAEAQSELIRYIDLKHEQLVYDFRGIFADRTAQQNDKIADHERRIHQVERKLELAA